MMKEMTGFLKLILENHILQSVETSLTPQVLIIIVRVGTAQRSQHLFNLVKVHVVKFSLTVTSHKKWTRLRRVHSALQTIVHNSYQPLPKMMASKEALLLPQGVMALEATFVVILTTQVTWHAPSLQKQRWDPWVPQNKGQIVRGLVHLIDTHLMDLICQDLPHKGQCMQASPTRHIQVLVVWTSLVCLWGTDTEFC